MTREEVQDFLSMVQATYPNYNPPSRTAAVNAWTIALEEYGKDKIAMAFKVYMRTDTSGFAPSPGKLIDKIQSVTQPQELNEMEAWALVSKAIRNSGYNSAEEFEKLPPLVQKAVGIPAQLRTWALDENYNEQVVSSNFIKCYRNEVSRQKEFSKMPTEVKQLIQNATRSPNLAQIESLRTKVIKSLFKAENNLEIENKSAQAPIDFMDMVKERIGE